MNPGHLSTMVQMSDLQSSGESIRKSGFTATNGFDPYQVMLKRRQRATDDDTINYKDIEVVQYDSEDVRALEEFCKQYNILGFNCGKMGPKAALNMLKNKLGVITEKIDNKKILLG